VPDGLSAEKQAAVMEKFADEFPRGFFLARRPEASYHLKIRSLGEGRKDRRGHTMDLAFIAYGGLAQLSKDDALDQLLGLNKGKGQKFLSDKELKERKITPNASVDERFVVMDAPLVDQVQLSGVLRTQKIKRDKSLISAAMLDTQFADDKEYPNRWQPITQKPGEKPVLGKKNPYRGFGGYVKATELAEPKGALFIELHFVFHEPYDWFEGHNVLASKLPLAVRDNVLTLRRKLMKAR
jgi:hypothetical protein